MAIIIIIIFIIIISIIFIMYVFLFFGSHIPHIVNNLYAYCVKCRVR